MNLESLPILVLDMSMLMESVRKISHMKVEAVFPMNKYEKVTVKVKDLKLSITVEQLEQAGGQKKVKFKNLTRRFYRVDSGDIRLSASADSMEVMQ